MSTPCTAWHPLTASDWRWCGDAIASLHTWPKCFWGCPIHTNVVQATAWWEVGSVTVITPPGHMGPPTSLARPLLLTQRSALQNASGPWHWVRPFSVPTQTRHRHTTGHRQPNWLLDPALKRLVADNEPGPYCLHFMLKTKKAKEILTRNHLFNVWQHMSVLKVNLLLLTFVFNLWTVGGNLEFTGTPFLPVHHIF